MKIQSHRAKYPVSQLEHDERRERIRRRLFSRHEPSATPPAFEGLQCLPSLLLAAAATSAAAGFRAKAVLDEVQFYW